MHFFEIERMKFLSRGLEYVGFRDKCGRHLIFVESAILEDFSFHADHERLQSGRMNASPRERPMYEHDDERSNQRRRCRRSTDNDAAQRGAEKDPDHIIERRTLAEGPSTRDSNENKCREKNDDRSGRHLQGIEVPAFSEYRYEDVHRVLR